MIQIKRAYDPSSRADGRRILVERLWPRGVKKEALAADAWLKDVAPSTELRKWFDHQEPRWEEFQRRYRDELDGNAEALTPLLDAVHEGGTVTLVYGARDTLHNGALVLRDYLSQHVTGHGGGKGKGRPTRRSLTEERRGPGPSRRRSSRPA